MSYEWFNNTFPMRAFWGFNEGSTYERVNGYAPATGNNPSMRPGVGLYTGSAGTGCLSYGNVLDITDTTAPFTMVADVDLSDRASANNFSVIVNKRFGGFNPSWSLSLRYGTTPYLAMSSAGGSLSATLPALTLGKRATIIYSYDGSLVLGSVKGYENGVPVAVGGASTLPATTLLTAFPAYIGYTAASNPFGINIRTVAWIDRAVTGSEAARIYEHLRTERPARIHPRRKFSIPMPLRTQTKELADGYIYAAAGGMAGGKWPDLIQGVRPATRVGPIDVAAHGVFDQCVVNNYVAGGTVPAASLTLPAGDTDVFNSNDWTFSCWLQVPVASAAVRKILQLDGTNYYIALDAAEKIQVSSVNGAAAQVTTTSTAALVTGKWYHVLVSRQMVGADMRTRILLDGTVDTDSTAAGIGVTLPGAGNPRLADGGMSIDAVRYRKDVITSDADARTECLQGGKQVLFDGRLCKTGCCPVMPVAATTAGTPIPGTGYTLQSAGSVRTVEDAPVGTVLGARNIFLGNGLVTVPDTASPYGSWLTTAKMSAVGDGMYVGFSMRDNAMSGAGLALLLSGFGITMRSLAGVSVWTAAGALAADVTYRFWVSRDRLDSVSLWVRGGAYAAWTLVVPTSGGTNPFVSGLSYAQRFNGASRFGGTTNYFGGTIHYRTAMTPTEAIALGILEP